MHWFSGSVEDTLWNSFYDMLKCSKENKKNAIDYKSWFLHMQPLSRITNKVYYPKRPWCPAKYTPP